MPRPKKGTFLRPSPYTTDAPYSDDHLEWLKAVDAYQRSTRRRHLAVNEILHLAGSLGYRKP